MTNRIPTPPLTVGALPDKLEKPPGIPGDVPNGPFVHPNHPNPHPNLAVKRQDYYPSLLPDQVLWLAHFASQLPLQAAALKLSAEQVADAVADALWLVYLLGPWRTSARAWSRGIAALLEDAQTGTGTTARPLHVYQAPPLPDGVVPRPPGALKRIFQLVQVIKAQPGCTESIRSSLGLKTRPDDRQHLAPQIDLSLTRAEASEIVIVRGKRWGHLGLLVEGRRGGGDWEEVGILGSRQFRDERPLLVPGQPEVRDYRARFWDGSEDLSGDWSPVATITVSP